MATPVNTAVLIEAITTLLAEGTDSDVQSFIYRLNPYRVDSFLERTASGNVCRYRLLLEDNGFPWYNYPSG